MSDLPDNAIGKLPRYAGVIQYAERGLRLTIPTDNGDIILGVNILGCPEGMDEYDMAEAVGAGLHESCYSHEVGVTSFPAVLTDLLLESNDPETHI